MIKQTKTYIYIGLLTFFLISGCIDKIELKSSLNNKTLVVDAILTTELKKHQINLSYGYNFNESEPTYPQNATVKVFDTNGNTFNYTQVNKKGVYESVIEFKAEQNLAYTLEIQTEDGNTYISKPEKTSGSSVIKTINVKKGIDKLGNNGLYLNVESQDSNNGAQYFKYDFVETYKISAPNWSNLDAIIESYNPFEYKVFNVNTAKNCYITNTSKDIIIFDNTSFSSNNVNFDLLFIEKNSPKINERYSILLTQKVQSSDVHNYYKALKKISSSEDVFTGVQPGNISSNITSTTSNNNVIGYFEVSSVSKKRIFFNYTDFYDDLKVNYMEECTTIIPFISDPDDPLAPSPLQDAIRKGMVFISETGDITRPFILTTKGCKDCREYGTDVKPNFWID